MKTLTYLIFSICILIGCSSALTHQTVKEGEENTDTIETDTAKVMRLTEEDYQRVADELNIEVATMKAVVEIEAGTAHEGFAAPGKPIVNFDATLFRRFTRKAGKSIGKTNRSTAFRKPDTRRHGTFGLAQWARLESAREINKSIAESATFWGMFQIGGFNWKLCGCQSLDEFVTRMCTSEAEQLEIFAVFIKNSKLLPYLQKKNWSKFAYRYNGPSYKSRGYDRKLRTAYAKHSKKSPK